MNKIEIVIAFNARQAVLFDDLANLGKPRLTFPGFLAQTIQFLIACDFGGMRLLLRQLLGSRRSGLRAGLGFLLLPGLLVFLLLGLFGLPGTDQPSLQQLLTQRQTHDDLNLIPKERPLVYAGAPCDAPAELPLTSCS